MTPFIDRLVAAVRQKRTPALVGLDPRLEQLPEAIRDKVDASDSAAVAEAYRVFCEGVVDAVASIVPAVKPQAAFFERLGPPGMGALAAVIDHAAKRDLVVILDAKRGDIGSTAAGYADAYLGASSAWHADALTVNPYLGDDSLQPFVEVAGERSAGIFVLVKTSNPGGRMFQDLLSADLPVYRYVAQHVEELAVQTESPSGYGAVGAVVGATYPTQLAELRAAMPHTWILIPGFGAQGGSAADVAPGFDEHGLGAIVNSSRGVIFASSRAPYKDRYSAEQWQNATEHAARDMVEQLRADTPASRL